MNNEILEKFGDCAEFTAIKKIVLKERQSTFIGLNDDKFNFIKVKVDNCLNIKGKRCDFLLLRIDTNFAYFIELKGKDLDKAVKQLGNSITKINEIFVIEEYIKIAFVILTKNPLASTQVQNLQKKFKKYYNTKLLIKNRKIEYKFY